ncbi:MAG: hypothetical protein ABEK50_15470 [bacterium]
MPKASGSKSSRSVTWLLQRVTGVVLILLLLAHFWVQHFFINDFYGKMNIVELNKSKKTFVQKLNEINPLWGKHSETYLAPVRTSMKNSKHYLTHEAIKGKGPTPITILEQNNRTEIFKGHLSKLELPEVIDGELSADAQILHKTINSDNLKTKLMINHSDVQARVSNIWWKTYNLLFLFLAIYHGLTGMWDLLQDYKMRPLVRMTLYGTVSTLGLILLTVGLLIIVPMGL